jgi:PAS domain S-box-containing protein
VIDVAENPIRIVVADDSIAMRMAIIEILNSEKDLAVVGSATDAPSALDLVKSLEPDIVVTDVWMPGGGGVALCKGIQELAKPPRVVAISASLIRGTQDAMLDAGASAFLLKDTADKDLVKVVHEVMEKPLIRIAKGEHESPPVAVRVVDRFGKIFGWNSGAEALYGWSAKEVVGRDVRDTTPRLHTLTLTSPMMEQLSLGHTWETDLVELRRDSTEFKAHVTYTPVIEMGVVQCVVVVSHHLS